MSIRTSPLQYVTHSLLVEFILSNIAFLLNLLSYHLHRLCNLFLYTITYTKTINVDGPLWHWHFHCGHFLFYSCISCICWHFRGHGNVRQSHGKFMKILYFKMGMNPEWRWSEALWMLLFWSVSCRMKFKVVFCALALLPGIKVKSEWLTMRPTVTSWHCHRHSVQFVWLLNCVWGGKKKYR